MNYFKNTIVLLGLFSMSDLFLSQRFKRMFSQGVRFTLSN